MDQNHQMKKYEKNVNTLLILLSFLQPSLPQISEAIKRLLRLSAIGVAAVFPAELSSYSQLAENATIATTTTLAPLVSQSPLEGAADGDSHAVQFRALQYALFSTSFVEVIGGVFFLLTAMYILRDRRNVERVVAGEFALGQRELDLEKLALAALDAL